MKFIKNTMIITSNRVVVMHRMLKNKRSKLAKKILEINQLLNKKDHHLIEEMNKTGAYIVIKYPSCDWKIKNTTKLLMNSI